MKILVIQNKMIGDVLTSSILFEALREKYPKAQLHYLIQQHTEQVVENNPFIDKLLLFAPKEESTLELARRVKSEKYEVVIDVYSKLNSALVTALSGAGKRISYYKWYTAPAYTQTFQLKNSLATNAGFAIENRMLLLQGLSSDFPVELKPKIYLTEAERTAAGNRLEAEGVTLEKPLLMISILGSSGKKTYPPKYMAQLLDFIVAETGAQLLFNYIPKQLEEANELYELCSIETQKHIHFEIFGKSLRDFIALTSHCDALIGNEGGAVNMAKALDIPTFAIFSPQIKKENWSIYEDGEQNVSVHLNDFRPELFGELSKKELLKKAPDFYELQQTNLILVKLKRFLEMNLKKPSQQAKQNHN